MKSHPILEAIAVFVSLAASACISIDDLDDKPKTTTVTIETVPPLSADQSQRDYDRNYDHALTLVVSFAAKVTTVGDLI